MLSVHTSPLEQPGTGDAGGLNVYVLEVAQRLATTGVAVEIITRGAPEGAPTAAVAPGVTVRTLDIGSGRAVEKGDLPAQLCAMTAALLRTEEQRGVGYFDLIHSHYWLSGQVGAVAADHWGVPLVHSMHTMALVKNAQLAEGDDPEPQLRVLGERQVVTAADMLVANTDGEASDLEALYEADPRHVAVAHPGVDLDAFRPGDQDQDRLDLGLPLRRPILLFVGRIQPLKAPDVFVRAAAELAAQTGRFAEPPLAIVCGGPSGAGPERVEALRRLAHDLGAADVVQFEPPADRGRLASLYRAADVVCVPSYSESFGLVALEAQACGSPVVAADVGGLRTSVADGRSGLLLDSHDPTRWADAIGRLLADSRRLAAMRVNARDHAEQFSWSATAASTLAAYRRAVLLRCERDSVRDRTG